ncbi:MAG: hypothetical protein CL431_10745 [Acidimicrobiaceae bacterium]|jgi:hypothetical protein|nr:hypothetical protein [Acidimicrobiaceae bacterium]|tara:strand:+ start:2096 stop:2980 length:885 start_codon:yes stop_codon:yes gene_type:complete
MSRNSKRTKVQQRQEPPQTPQHNVPPPEMPKQNPFGISFVVPTEIVHLPSGGEFYEESSPLKGLKTLEIKSMTAKEEDIVMNQNYINEGIVFDKLIDSLMITENINSKEILDCDKLALLMSAAKTGYGEDLEMLFSCDNCSFEGPVKASLTKILEDMKNRTFGIADTEEVKYDETSKTLLFDLPITKISVRIKTMTPNDYKYLEESKKQKEKLNLPFSDTLEFLRRILVEANGVTTPGEIFKLTEVLPTADARTIVKIHNTSIPKIDKTQMICCPECNHEQKEDVPFSLGMFWS